MTEAVRLVVWDLDETYWKGTLTEGGIREYVQAHHDIVIALARRGILSSICSKNDSAVVLPILEEKGIRDYFIFPSISWEPKGMRLAQLVETVQLRAPTIMFIDDNPNNRAEAAAIVPGLQIEDETFIPKMLQDPRFKGKDDSELSRLTQYKLLEARKRDEEQAEGGNEEFLRSCDIRVYIEYDVDAHIDRAIELINRTNQLNYTKKRLSENGDIARKQLREQLAPFGRAAGLIRVMDKYGDYGFVGFFMTGGMRETFETGAANTHFVHFCFSCRTLGMLVEQWLYDYLGRPELNVVGDVLTNLFISRNIDWIRLVSSLEKFDTGQEKIASQIVLYGGCEANVLSLYMQQYTNTLDVYGNYVANGIFVNVNYVARLLDVCNRKLEQITPELKTLGLPMHLEGGDIFGTAAPEALFVFNFGSDAHGTSRLRHKTHEWTFVLSPNNFGGGARLPIGEQELIAGLDAAKLSTSSQQRDHILRVNQHLHANYDVVRNPELAEIIDDIHTMIDLVPTGSKLVIIVDHDHVRMNVNDQGLTYLPWVTRYKDMIVDAVADYSFVAMIYCGDVLSGEEDILGANHYRREVYLRLAQRVAQIVQGLKPRSDSPSPTRRTTKFVAERLERKRRELGARELVQAGYECLMRRPPDTESGDYFQNAITSGSLSPAEFVRALTRTNEFKDKWNERGKAILRSDPTPSAGLAAAPGENDETRQKIDARDLVQAGYECLMRRPPDTGSEDYFVNALATGSLSSAGFVRALTGTDEFKDKWTMNTEQKVSTLGLIDPRVLRAPDDLLLTATHPKRALIVGSCLSEGWALRMRALPNPCESDVYLLGRDLPERPERPISEYDFQLVQLALRFVLPDASFARLSEADVEGHERLFAHAVNGMRRYLDGAMRWNREHGILTFVFPFLAPQQNAVGRLMPRYDLRNPVYFIEKLNEALAKELGAYRNAYFFDLNEIHAFYGRRYVQEDSYLAFNHGSYLSNFDFEHDQNRLEPAVKATDLLEARVFEVFTAAWQEFISMYRSVRQADAIKLVVIDLDDTLWRGVIAESDPENMPTSEGWPKGFWEALLFLKRRGILLAIISKNEESRVVEAWDKLVARQLKLDDFAIRRINWRPKPENMSEILAHVNLLPGNVLYIDDNPAERAAMKGAFPDIRVLGGTPLTWRRILLWSSETQVATITAESAARTDMVRAQVVREEQRATMSREEFLASLNVRMTLFEVENAEHPRFPRVFELINKTNQFNTTGKRWTREECVADFASGTAFYAFEVADHYTEYGLVGVLIVDATGIRQFVMSCRIMGLEAEVAAVAQIGALLREGGAKTLFAAMIETDRNQPCRNLYSRCGFEAVEGGWRRALAPWFDAPAHIALTVQRAKTGKTLAAAAE